MAEGGRRRQRRQVTTSDQLIRAARRVFAEKGYQAATVGAITQAADTAHGTFYLYFQNKRDAFSQVMTDICQRMYEEAEASWSGDPSEAVVGGVRRFFEIFAEHRGLWRALVEGSLQDPVIEAMWLDLRRPFVERLERLLEHLVAAGSIPPLDTAVAAPALGSMVEWFAFTHFVLGQPPEAEVDIDRAARGVADVWMRSVFVSGDAPAAVTSTN